jgi:L-fuculose-phosphate aldolase
MQLPADIPPRARLVHYAQRLDQLGLNRGTSGNVSLRDGETFLITPTQIPTDELTPESIVAMDFGGNVLGPGRPSVEWHFHRAILAARPEVNAVVHTHSRYATALACLQRGVPPFHYMIAVAGGDSIRCTPYAMFGTPQLADLALAALAGRRACLLGNHGMIAVGTDLARALYVAVETETLCEQYWTALQLGEPYILTPAEMDVVLEKFYGTAGPRYEARDFAKEIK